MSSSFEMKSRKSCERFDSGASGLRSASDAFSVTTQNEGGCIYHVVCIIPSLVFGKSNCENVGLGGDCVSCSGCENCSRCEVGQWTPRPYCHHATSRFFILAFSFLPLRSPVPVRTVGLCDLRCTFWGCGEMKCSKVQPSTIRIAFSLFV